MGVKRQPRARAHMQPPEIDRNCIRSGQQTASIVHEGEFASIGDGDDGSLWILVHDPERRPRGRNPGVVVETDQVSFEENGLVRILDRRVSQDTIERLIADLTGRHASIGDSLAKRSQIPPGNYAGITVEPIDGHYRVQAHGAAAQRLADMPSLGANRWLVLANDESLLRRELVRQLMPVHHRVAWAMVKEGVRILVSSSALLIALSLLEPRILPFTAASIIALGLMHWRKRSIVNWARQRWVQPCIDRTLLGTRKPSGQNVRITVGSFGSASARAQVK